MRIAKIATQSIFLIVIIIGVAVVSLELKRRLGLYWYDVRDDYYYNFSDDSSNTIPVRVTRDSVVIPPSTTSAGTAVLKIRVKASFAALWFEPSIKIRSKNQTWLHTLERRAAGNRYFVLPDTIPGAPTRFGLVGKHISWDEQDGTLLRFQNPQMENARILVIAPHPDDAEIAAFGLYSHHFAYIVNITTGNYVDGLYSNLVPDYRVQDELRGRVRVWDSITVPLWGNVAHDRIVNLGYATNTLVTMHQRHAGSITEASPVLPDPNTYRHGATATLLQNRQAEAEWSSLVEDIASVITAAKPTFLVTPHPALDAAEDHKYTTLAVLDALRMVNDTETILLTYTNHHILSEYYPFGPTASAVTLPPWFDATIIASGIYSNTMDANDQMDKLFALEAMHDLRDPPYELHGGPTQRFLKRISLATGSLIRNPLGTYDYFRRAVRQNEVFFVVRPEDRRILSLREN